MIFKIKVTEGDAQLVHKELTIECTGSSPGEVFGFHFEYNVYHCHEYNCEFVDSYEEFNDIETLYADGNTDFFDCNAFLENNGTLMYIDAFVLLDVK